MKNLKLINCFNLLLLIIVIDGSHIQKTLSSSSFSSFFSTAIPKRITRQELRHNPNNSNNNSNNNNTINYLSNDDKNILNNINAGSLIDLNIDPCDDFYEYSCGNWDKISLQSHFENNNNNNNIPKDILEILLEKTLWKYKNLIEKQQKLYSENKNTLEVAEIKAIEHYRSCSMYYRSENHTKNERLKPFLDELNSLGSWPLMDPFWASLSLPTSSTSSSLNWVKIVANFRRYGIQTLFRQLIKSNWKNSTEQILYFVQPKFNYIQQNGNSNVINDDEAFLYKTEIKHILLDLGVRIRQAKLITNEIYNFELSLVNLMEPESLIDVPEPQPFKNLLENVPEIDWKLYLDTVLNKTAKLSMKIIIQQDYFRKLNILMAHTNSETLGKYFVVKFLMHFQDIYQVQRDLNTWKYCLKDIGSKMGSVLNYILQNEQNNEQKYDNVNEIFFEIQQIFKMTIMNSDWLDRTTKYRAIQKLNNLKIEIGNPVQNINKINEYFSILKINEINYAQNIMNFEKFETFKDYQRLYLDTGNTEFDNSNPLRANAYYQLSKNKITIPSSVLESPLYDESFSIAQKFGGLGTIFGHELIHGFDLDGKNYDGQGNAIEWWTVKSFIKYWEKIDCLMTKNKMHRRKVLKTLNEDIADNAGLKLSYAAYKQYSTKQYIQISNENERSFFLSFAQVFCSSRNSRTREISWESKHAEHKTRVIETLSNFHPFSRTFNCVLDTNMNSRIKCELW